MILATTNCGLLLAVISCLLVGCSSPGGEDPEDSDRAAVKLVPHAYFPRTLDEGYWETIRLEDAGPEFLLFVRPQILSPAEGPWTVTIRRSSGEVLTRHPGVRVDVATGRLTFLCSSRHFSPGDWTLELELEEGGLGRGERKRVYCFRVE